MCMFGNLNVDCFDCPNNFKILCGAISDAEVSIEEAITFACLKALKEVRSKIYDWNVREEVTNNYPLFSIYGIAPIIDGADFCKKSLLDIIEDKIDSIEDGICRE